MAENPSVAPPPEMQSAFVGGAPSYYANTINVTLTIHDVRLSFGKMSPYSSPAYDTHVYLSLPAAKQLVAMLGDMIRDYEARFGAVPVAPKDAP